jgi:hypothetical protein
MRGGAQGGAEMYPCEREGARYINRRLLSRMAHVMMVACQLCVPCHRDGSQRVAHVMIAAAHIEYDVRVKQCVVPKSYHQSRLKRYHSLLPILRIAILSHTYSYRIITTTCIWY